MFTEESIINTLVIGAIISGVIGAWIASVIFIERDEVKNVINRQKATRGASNYARRRAQLASASKVIQKY